MDRKIIELLLRDRIDPPPDLADDVLVPDPLVASIHNVCLRTIARWDQRPELGFPEAERIGNRKYRRLSKLRAWSHTQRAAAGGEVD